MPDVNHRVPLLRPDGLQLDEPLAFQRGTWRLQRLAWILFLLLIAAALLGLTGGGGPLSRQHVELDGATIDLPLISRWQMSDDLIIEFSGDAPRAVTFGNALARGFTVESIYPQPARQSVSDRGTMLKFDGADSGTHSVRIALRPSGPGLVTFDLSSGKATASRSILVLP
jgi:hypothetical protein